MVAADVAEIDHTSLSAMILIIFLAVLYHDHTYQLVATQEFHPHYASTGKSDPEQSARRRPDNDLTIPGDFTDNRQAVG